MEHARILFVDDEKTVLDGIRRLLHERMRAWEVVMATSVDEALNTARTAGVDVIVTDVNMPGKGGLDLLREVQDDPELCVIPVVMLTGMADSDLKREAINMGAIDLLTKPLSPEDMVARLKSALRIRGYQMQLREENARLEGRIQDRTEELQQAKTEIIWRLARAGDFRDEETGAHVARVAYASKLLAEEIGLSSTEVEHIFLASTLHDIGKIGIPDAVLLKRGPLTSKERRIVETHCEIGREILAGSIPNLNIKARRNPLLEVAAMIANSHHERWDGNGYPHGLSGEAIPMAARIVAVADVLDALCHERPYKPAMPFEQAATIIRQETGKHFDPRVVEAFDRCEEELIGIMHRIPDPVIARSLLDAA